MRERPKGRSSRIVIRLLASPGSTIADVARWRGELAKAFAELAVEVAMQEQQRAITMPAVKPAGSAREFRMTDYESVLALWKASEGVVLTDADKRLGVARYLRRNPGTSFIWEVNGCVVGAVLAGSDGRRGFLHHLAVAAEHRRNGIGRELVEHALAALSKAGIEKCDLLVLSSNATAREVWKRLGWLERTNVALMSRMLAHGGSLRHE